MEEILIRARELGLMLKQTDESEAYKNALHKLESNHELSTRFKELEEQSADLAQKKEAGLLEDHELQDFMARFNELKEHDIIAEFIEARNQYSELLETVQKALLRE